MRYTSLVLTSMSSSSGGSVAVPVYAVIWVSNLPNAERSLSWNSKVSGSTTDECYISPVATYTPAGAVNLWLRLNFADPSHVISIGIVAVHFM